VSTLFSRVAAQVNENLSLLIYCDFIELLIDELTNSIHNKLIEIFIDAL